MKNVKKQLDNTNYMTRNAVVYCIDTLLNMYMYNDYNDYHGYRNLVSKAKQTDKKFYTLWIHMDGLTRCEVREEFSEYKREILNSTAA